MYILKVDCSQMLHFSRCSYKVEINKRYEVEERKLLRNHLVMSCNSCLIIILQCLLMKPDRPQLSFVCFFFSFQSKLNLGHSDKKKKKKKNIGARQIPITTLAITTTPFPFVFEKQKAARNYSRSTFLRIERDYMNQLLVLFNTQNDDLFCMDALFFLFNDVFWSNDCLTTFSFICLTEAIEAVWESHLKPSANYENTRNLCMSRKTSARRC